MKTDVIEVSDTRKNLVIEIPSTIVDSEIYRVARDYSKAARIPGFRPGKVPAKLVRQRFRDQILHDVAHGHAKPLPVCFRHLSDSSPCWYSRATAPG